MRRIVLSMFGEEQAVLIFTLCFYFHKYRRAVDVVVDYFDLFVLLIPQFVSFYFNGVVWGGGHQNSSTMNGVD